MNLLYSPPAAHSIASLPRLTTGWFRSFPTLLVVAGEMVESTVHLLGVTHDCPINPRAVYEVASAVQPDAFAMEGTEDMRNDMRKAAGSTHLLSLLDRVMATPIEDVRQAHMLLSQEERERWKLGLGSVGTILGDDTEQMLHYLSCRPRLSKILAGEG